MPLHPRIDPGTLILAAAWQWTPAGVATLAATVVFVGLAAYVWRRRGGSTGAALALVLVAVLLWAGAYAAELGATELAAKRRWGDFKYVGICLLPPAWFAFAALFSGRGHWVNRRNLLLLAVEPLLVLALLANRATHGLIRWYPASAAGLADATGRPLDEVLPEAAGLPEELAVSRGGATAATSSPACPCPTGRARPSAGWWCCATSPSATAPSAACAASTSSAASCWSGW